MLHRAIYQTLMAICLLLPISATAESKAFLPTWKLLSDQDRIHFVAGYLQARRELNQVLEITEGFVETEPKTAPESLRSLRKIYSLNVKDPRELAKKLEQYFKQPSNMDHSLSKAVSSVARQ